ncbi:proton-dependent oligopeptide transport family protein [Senna tora]|uniref:Proton-dependent oligopeptide transport family protein n=1 Tax=Senna tora TaxID=362788 RepID=A0A834X168_9FABA|nr:proton-dependent oligopeptide transport family protein [Senna tora]
MRSITIVIAAVVEMKRLKLAKEYGVVDDPDAMSILCWIPQYLLFGITEILTVFGLQVLFYDDQEITGKDGQSIKSTPNSILS